MARLMPVFTPGHMSDGHMPDGPMSVELMPDDACFLAHALSLGRRHHGLAAPNPSVGCVIVKDGRVLGRGVTAPGGAPHGETIALDEAGAAARGAVAYTGLEPCAHHGRTPPCAEALIEAGVERVVYPLDDPDPRVAGRGRALLEAAGIDVVTGLLAEQARFDHRGFFTRILKSRPYMILKLAVSADGRIAEQRGRPAVITGPLARRRGHLMRAHADGILVGIGTVLTDDPELTCRIEGLEDRSPIRVVLDSTARLPVTSKLAETARQTPVWLITGDDAPADRCAALEAKGVEIIQSPLNARQIDLKTALEALGARGLNTVLAEGGAKIAQSLVEAGLADELALFEASHELGRQGLDALGDLPLSAVTENPEFRVHHTLTVEPDRLTRYIRTAL